MPPQGDSHAWGRKRRRFRPDELRVGLEVLDTRSPFKRGVVVSVSKSQFVARVGWEDGKRTRRWYLNLKRP